MLTHAFHSGRPSTTASKSNAHVFDGIPEELLPELSTVDVDNGINKSTQLSWRGQYEYTTIDANDMLLSIPEPLPATHRRGTGPSLSEVDKVFSSTHAAIPKEVTWLHCLYIYMAGG